VQWKGVVTKKVWARVWKERRNRENTWRRNQALEIYFQEDRKENHTLKEGKMLGTALV